MRLIDADLLTERLNNAIECGRRVDMPTLELEAVLANVQNTPSIDIEPKRGEWKRRIVDNGFNADWVCSECGYRVKTDFVDYNFCPNCGADMREVRDE